MKIRQSSESTSFLWEAAEGVFDRQSGGKLTGDCPEDGPAEVP